MTDSYRASRMGRLVRKGLSSSLLAFFDLYELILLSVVFEMGN